MNTIEWICDYTNDSGRHKVEITADTKGKAKAELNRLYKPKRIHSIKAKPTQEVIMRYKRGD